MPILLDGKNLAAQIRQELRESISGKKSPGLAVILVGEDPSSLIYVKNKAKAAEEIGIRYEYHHLEKNSSPAQILSLIENLNQKPEINGILIQQPLPPHLDPEILINQVLAIKDVDGIGKINNGALWQNSQQEHLFAATPSGIIRLLKEYQINLKGLKALVIGRSNIVG
nr:bifunctional 5,10-methylenetetrahydrofolate dehydrogenase/5,10-methenyltetrahydrofolate cyclohydrolase [Candidatus Gracilibacteria bacterium]